jgi:NAD(P)-dependent dehydrogenase (short-subunit alcohol dehydrogenase family)
VNNAGVAGPTGRVEEIDPARGTSCIASTSPGNSTARGSRAAPAQVANASIVNVSSLAGRLGFALRTPTPRRSGA